MRLSCAASFRNSPSAGSLIFPAAFPPIRKIIFARDGATSYILMCRHAQRNRVSPAYLSSAEETQELSSHHHHMGNGHSVPPILLTIAGFDPSCGAGIAADLKTFAAHNCYGVAAITAITVQSTQGVRAVNATPAATMRAQLDALAEDSNLAGVKIGMLANRANAS